MEESYFGFNIAGIISNGMVGDKMDTDLFPRRRDLYENMLKNMKGNIKDIVSNRGRRRALLKDLYENIFGA